MTARFAAAGLACLALAGCGQSLATDASEAQLAYGIAKGVAVQAVAGDPSLTAKVESIEAKADPIVAAAVTTATAPALAGLAQDLLVATAAQVHVVSNTAPAMAPQP